MDSTQVFRTSPASHAPPLALLATEPLRALFDYFAAHTGGQPSQVGDGHPVVVYPGLGGGAFTTSHLRGFLKDSGFTVHDWEGGVNTGPEGVFDDWLGTLDDRVKELHGLHNRKVSLIGWSLGGVYAREVAKRCPALVRQVITLGTPFSVLGLPPRIQARLRQSPPVPTTSVYSKSDGFVSWRGCLVRKTERSENIEVPASHLGMVTHPEVLRILADRLSQPEGQWRPFSRAQPA